MKLYLAPLEGVTGYIYRNAYEKIYGHIDKYFAPFISPAQNCPMTPKERKDILPDNNPGINLVPQILTCKSEHFIECAEELKSLGYSEINLNLGCPSGTVCAKKKGAGFLPETPELKAFLEDIYSYGENNNISISLKTRLGYFNPDEFYDLLDIFNDYPVSELIVHPRIRSDFYKGVPRYEYYAYALEHSRVPLVYNGNIFSMSDYNYLCKKMNTKIDTVMIGRGSVINPGLAEELLTGNDEFDFDRFWTFHDILYSEYQKVMSPDINVLHRMRELWSYWRDSFEGCEKDIKNLVKAKKYAEYETILRNIKT